MPRGSPWAGPGIKALAVAVLIAPLMLFGSVQGTTTPDAAVSRYCSTCHNDRTKTAGLVLDPAQAGRAGENAEVWEKVVRKLRSGAMPPPGASRPDAATYASTASFLESTLDRAAAARPNAGQLPLLRRLTRTEYQNAIRDLFALHDLPREMDYSMLLPADSATSGFDNIADLLFVSPTTMERYLEAARKISRLAVGDPTAPVLVNIHQMSDELPQDARVEELPVGTRGGLAIRSHFPVDGEYLVEVELSGSRSGDQQLEISVDNVRVALVRTDRLAPLRLPVKAGPRLVGVTFLQRNEALPEATLLPRMRSQGTQVAVNRVTIRGPFVATGAGDTPSRRRIFTCRPASSTEETGCARRILSDLARRAYRRPVADADLTDLMPFYTSGRKEGDFDLGIQRAIERMLVSPQFLFRIEREPAGIARNTAFPVSNLELASRLSFFIWSSIPDDELLSAAINGTLKNPDVLEKHVRRMLADPRSESLVTNFGAQWLFLGDVALKEPDPLLFRHFDDSLRRAMVRETELFLTSVLRSDHSVLRLLDADYTFLNERLAEHYGIPNVKGSDFRRVALPPGGPRSGLLGQGSILTLTSYPTRTSPVLRGKYVLENLLASPPPPPPADVPALNTAGEKRGETLTLREAMVQHRANPACSGCHSAMDPIGFSMENFDAVGRWRERDAGKTIDSSGVLPGGVAFDGIAGLKKVLLSQPEPFVSAFTEKLMMYATGRNVQYYDMPAVRKIVRDSVKENYTFASLVLNLVKTAPTEDGGTSMFITKKALSRRTFLRGAGATLALPFLDAMSPALRAQSRTPVPRLGFLYIPNGVIHKMWTPTTTGQGFTLSPTLAALEPFKSHINVLTGLDHWEAESKGDGTGDHPRASAVWLTGVHAYNRTKPGVPVKLAKTADQFAADVIGRDTRLASLELTLEVPTQGGCDSGDCFYSDTVSWRNESTPNMTEPHPRLVFERLFGDGGSSEQLLARARQAGSILDSVMAETSRLSGSLGAGDRAKLTEYLDSVREVERRIQNAESRGLQSIEAPERPTDIPSSFVDHAHVMFDLAALAFQADVTRVFTLVIGRELTGRSYPHIGVRDGHHNISHHRGDGETIVRVARIDAHHVELLSYFLKKLQSLKEDSGTLLDNSLVMYGGGMGDGNLHGHTNLPCLLAGKLGGSLKTGYHTVYPAKTPMANLLLTVLDKVGVRLDKLGDSTGRLTPDLLSIG